MKTHLKTEAIRLRTKEHKSLKDIADILHISKGTASRWLKLYPLTKEQQKKSWISHPKIKREKPTIIESKYQKIIPFSKLSKAQKAQLAETAVLFRLVLHDFTPLSPVFEGDIADWVIRRQDGKMKTIQVKWAHRNKTSQPTISLRHSSGRRFSGQNSTYTKGSFDFIVGYDYYTDTCYIYSWDEIKNHKACISVSEKHAENWDMINVDVDQLEDR